ncbi:hypothetical protein [Halobacterium sp. R2-5]|uniref:hypothetical protein n=1 Tax=Halobacterium sp. R2-5 TaxID=2715751 RepID=UPI0014221688|nr:hypothetical protein [Halobacterium sp. R2-5]NIB99182.1 hypothetical protein [Halobacterium sp. R2-5]
MPSPSRRGLLRSLAPLPALAAAAGCTALDSPSKTSLRELYAVNGRETAHALHVRVSADDERVLETSVELPPGGRERLDCAWPTDARSYTLAASADGADWHRHTVASGDDECLTAELVAGENDVAFGTFDQCPTGIGESCR